MLNSKKYTMDIISHHPQFNNRPMKKFAVDGVDTIGAWGDEPFEIKFRNNTGSRVQVKFSIDGTDILSGELATTSPDSQMWMVSAYGSINLKAWPESKNGGAAFVFTSAANSVAANTHGNTSNRGIIAAAVFEEGHVVARMEYDDSVRISDHGNRRSKSLSFNSGDVTKGCGPKECDPTRAREYCNDSLDCDNFGAGPASASMNTSSGTLDCFDNAEYERRSTADIKSLASVGAGSFTTQHLSYVKGLIKPTFAEAIQIKYEWWDELKNKLSSDTYIQEPNGFPGDQPHKMINLQGTPRVKTAYQQKPGYFRRIEQEYLSRF